MRKSELSLIEKELAEDYIQDRLLDAQDIKQEQEKNGKE